MQIKFNNGKILNCLNSLEQEEYYNGSNRRTLTVDFDKSYNFDELNKLVSDTENTKSIEVIADTWQNVYDNYTIKLSLGVVQKLIEETTPDSPASYEERIILKLGKLTYIEAQLAALGIK